MKYVTIRGLDKAVSQLVMGTSWMDLSKKEVIDVLLEDFVTSGGNLIDTGRFYNGSKTETYLKGWIQYSGLRDKVMFTNKACHYYVDENNIHHPEISRVNPECITEDLEFSLNNLGLDHFDIYMLHRDNEEVPVGPLMDRLEQLRLEGKITVYGVSNWSIARMEEAQKYCEEKGYQGISVNSASYSMATIPTPRWAGCVYANDEYAAWHKDKGVTLLSWGSQGGGFFSASYPVDANQRKDFEKAYFNSENFEKLRRAKELAKEKGESMTAVNIALDYILSQDLDICAIIGPRNSKEFFSSLSTYPILPLTKEEVEWLSLRSDVLKAEKELVGV